MIEAEWLASEDPVRMLDALPGILRCDDEQSPPGLGVSDRKLRLFAMALARHSRDMLSQADIRADDALERYVDSGNTADLAGHWALPLTPARAFARNMARAFASPVSRGGFGQSPSFQAWLLREIVGNPFRKTDPDMLRSWQEMHAQYRPLAQAAYDERSVRQCEFCHGKGYFQTSNSHAECPRCTGPQGVGTGCIDDGSGQLDPDRLAVLSDALEDAGCTHKAILAHLRSPGPHYRGCWAVDLVLGKE